MKNIFYKCVLEFNFGNRQGSDRTKLLKRPKREMFVAGTFTEIRPVWVGDLETRPKNLKNLCLGPYLTLYFLRFLF